MFFTFFSFAPPLSDTTNIKNSIAKQTQKLLKNTKIWKTPTLEIQDDK